MRILAFALLAVVVCLPAAAQVQTNAALLNRVGASYTTRFDATSVANLPPVAFAGWAFTALQSLQDDSVVVGLRANNSSPSGDADFVDFFPHTVTSLFIANANVLGVIAGPAMFFYNVDPTGVSLNGVFEPGQGLYLDIHGSDNTDNVFPTPLVLPPLVYVGSSNNTDSNSGTTIFAVNSSNGRAVWANSYLAQATNYECTTDETAVTVWCAVYSNDNDVLSLVPLSAASGATAGRNVTIESDSDYFAFSVQAGQVFITEYSGNYAYIYSALSGAQLFNTTFTQSCDNIILPPIAISTYAYFTCDSYSYVVDLTSYQLLTTLTALGGHTFRAATVLPTGTIIAAAGPNIYTVSGPTMTRLLQLTFSSSSTVAVGGAYVAQTATQQLVAFSFQGNDVGTVVVLDALSGTITAQIAGSVNSVGPLAIDPVTNNIVVSSNDGAPLQVYSPAGVAGGTAAAFSMAKVPGSNGATNRPFVVNGTSTVYFFSNDRVWRAPLGTTAFANFSTLPNSDGNTAWPVVVGERVCTVQTGNSALVCADTATGIATSTSNIYYGNVQPLLVVDNTAVVSYQSGTAYYVNPTTGLSNSVGSLDGANGVAVSDVQLFAIQNSGASNVEDMPGAWALPLVTSTNIWSSQPADLTALSNLVYANGFVYVYGVNSALGGLFTLNILTGAVINVIVAEVGESNSWQYLQYMPGGVLGKLILFTSQQNPDVVTAFDLDAGAVAWTANPPCRPVTTGTRTVAVSSVANVIAFRCYDSYGVGAIDGATGATLWSTSFGSEGDAVLAVGKYVAFFDGNTIVVADARSGSLASAVTYANSADLAWTASLNANGNVVVTASSNFVVSATLALS